MPCDGGAAAGAGRRAALPKRFYKDVAVSGEEGAHGLLLDGKPVRTPGKALLALPSRALAEAIAEEWRAQGERVDPSTMPLTRLANTVIDGVQGREDAVAADILSHAAADLLLYQAEGPQALAEKQTEAWDPVLAWARAELGAPFVLAQGVMPVAQPESALAKTRDRYSGLDAYGLAALHVMTQLTGSALLPLAVARGKLTPDQAWKAAHVDEDYQIGQWGEDAEAAARHAARKRDFDAAARVLELRNTLSK
jgi:chaperone required for assembly of F1-ATPase